MSLLNEYFKPYYIMVKAETPSSEGGCITTWTEGALIDMALDDPNQTQKLIADSHNVEIICNALFRRSDAIEIGMYLRSADDENIVYMVRNMPCDAPQMGVALKKAEVIKTRLPE